MSNEPGGPLRPMDDPIGECHLCDEAIGGWGLKWNRILVPEPQGQYMTHRYRDVCVECIQKEENGP